VIAIEREPRRLAQARHNAALYGVAHRIEFVCGDACELVPTLEAELLFVDPPWGARYDKQRVSLLHLPLLASLLEQRARFARVWAKVPPSFDPSELARATLEAYFGVGRGDGRRIKFLLLELT